MPAYTIVANSTKADGSREIKVNVAGNKTYNIFVAQQSIDADGNTLTWEETCDLVSAQVQASLGDP